MCLDSIADGIFKMGVSRISMPRSFHKQPKFVYSGAKEWPIPIIDSWKFCESILSLIHEQILTNPCLLFVVKSFPFFDDHSLYAEPQSSHYSTGFVSFFRLSNFVLLLLDSKTTTTTTNFELWMMPEF